MSLSPNRMRPQHRTYMSNLRAAHGHKRSTELRETNPFTSEFNGAGTSTGFGNPLVNQCPCPLPSSSFPEDTETGQDASVVASERVHRASGRIFLDNPIPPGRHGIHMQVVCDGPDAPKSPLRASGPVRSRKGKQNSMKPRPGGLSATKDQSSWAQQQTNAKVIDISQTARVARGALAAHHRQQYNTRRSRTSIMG